MAMSEDVYSVDSVMYEIKNVRDYQLEQLTALISEKKSKEKIVDTLIKKLKQLHTVYSNYADLKVKIRQMEFEIESISENLVELRKHIKEKDTCISTLQLKSDNFDKHLTPEQIGEMIKAVEEGRRIDNQQRQMNEYYEEWRKRG